LQIVPNEQVQRVSIKRKKQGITVDKVHTESRTVKVGLPRVSPDKEPLLAATFPNAEIGAPSGFPKGVVIAASVVVGFIALCCLVSIIGPMLSR